MEKELTGKEEEPSALDQLQGVKAPDAGDRAGGPDGRVWGGTPETNWITSHHGKEASRFESSKAKLQHNHLVGEESRVVKTLDRPESIT